MPKLIRLFLLLLLSATLHAAEVWELDAADWARPRHGEWLVEHPALNEALASMQQSENGRLLIRYPGGDEGALWGGELQAWLVALGLESERIELLPGSAGANIIQLEVVETPN